MKSSRRSEFSRSSDTTTWTVSGRDFGPKVPESVGGARVAQGCSRLLLSELGAAYGTAAFGATTASCWLLLSKAFATNPDAFISSTNWRR